jgi:hypothetical protein
VSAAIIVEAGLALRARVASAPAVIVAPRRRRRRRRWPAREGWRPLDPAETMEVLRSAPRGALVLARAASADPGAAWLASLPTLAGLASLSLPEPLDAAVWTVALAAHWASEGADDLLRPLAVVCGLWERQAALPRREWGAADLPAPALRPGALARWASRAWRPCTWCRRGGGLASARCVLCGACVAEPAT